MKSLRNHYFIRRESVVNGLDSSTHFARQSTKWCGGVPFMVCGVLVESARRTIWMILNCGNSKNTKLRTSHHPKILETMVQHENQNGVGWM